MSRSIGFDPFFYRLPRSMPKRRRIISRNSSNEISPSPFISTSARIKSHSESSITGGSVVPLREGHYSSLSPMAVPAGFGDPSSSPPVLLFPLPPSNFFIFSAVIAPVLSISKMLNTSLRRSSLTTIMGSRFAMRNSE